MAHTKIVLTNGIELKTAPIGYSWTTLFFGPIPAAMRGDWPWAIGLTIGNILTYGLAGLVCSFFYNKQYAKSLINKGYKVHALPNGVTSDAVRTELGLLILPQQTP